MAENERKWEMGEESSEYHFFPPQREQMEVVFLVDLVGFKVMAESLRLLFSMEVNMLHPREEKQFEDSKGTVHFFGFQVVKHVWRLVGM